MANFLKNPSIIEKKIHIGEIPGLLFRPKEAKGQLPSILFYHGWGSNKENQRIRGFLLASIGYQVLLPDAIYHGQRGGGKEPDLEDAVKHFWETIFKNVEESKIIIDSLVKDYQADPERIGVSGNSMGGFTAAGIFAHNPDIKALVVLNGSCNWEDSNQVFKENFEIEDLEAYGAVEDRIGQMDPMNNLERLVNRPVLLLHGEDDVLVPMESQRLFYKKAKPLYEDQKNLAFVHYPYLNHYVTTNMMEEAMAWFYKHL